MSALLYGCNRLALEHLEENNEGGRVAVGLPHCTSINLLCLSKLRLSILIISGTHFYMCVHSILILISIKNQYNNIDSAL